MKKQKMEKIRWYYIDSIGHKVSAKNIFISIVFVFLLTFFIGYFFLPEPLWSMINKVSPDVVLLTVPSILVVLVLHEAIHVSMFFVLGKGRARIKPKLYRGALIMQQTNPFIRYSRIQMLFILLMPFLMISFLLAITEYRNVLAYLSFFNLIINGLSSSIDIYVAYKLITYHGHIYVGFQSNRTELDVYHRDG